MLHTVPTLHVVDANLNTHNCTFNIFLCLQGHHMLSFYGRTRIVGKGGLWVRQIVLTNFIYL